MLFALFVSPCLATARAQELEEAPSRAELRRAAAIGTAVGAAAGIGIGFAATACDEDRWGADCSDDRTLESFVLGGAASLLFAPFTTAFGVSYRMVKRGERSYFLRALGGAYYAPLIPAALSIPCGVMVPFGGEKWVTITLVTFAVSGSAALVAMPFLSSGVVYRQWRAERRVALSPALAPTRGALGSGLVLGIAGRF